MLGIRRNGTLIRKAGSNLLVGAGYRIQCRRPGALATGAPSGVTLNVRSGHGILVGDKILIYSIANGSYTYSGVNTVQSVTATTVVMSGGTYTVALGDVIFGLGADTSVGSTPNWDATPVALYGDYALETNLGVGYVTTGADGEYGYWHRGVRIWEIVTTVAGVPIDHKLDVSKANWNVVNVLDYGALADGSTDDGPAFQRAISAIPSTGAILYAPAGTYIIGDAVYLKSNVTLLGDGPGLTILKKKAASLYSNASENSQRNPVVAVGSALGVPYTNANPGANVAVRDLTLDGNSANQTLANYQHAYGFGVNNSWGVNTGGCVDGVRVENVAAQWTVSDGICIRGCKRIRVERCRTYKTGQTDQVATKNGITVTGGDDHDNGNGWGVDAIIRGNFVSYSGDAVTRQSEGIVVARMDNTIVSDNTIDHVDFGVEVTGTGNVTGLVIHNNRITDLTEVTTTAQIGITVSVQAPGVMTNLVISGNTIERVNNNGIYVGHAKGLVVADNVCRDVCRDGTQTIYQTGINVIDAEGYAITGNTVYLVTPSTEARGIVIQGNDATKVCSDGVVVGNSIFGAKFEGIFYSSSGAGRTNRRSLCANNFIYMDAAGPRRGIRVGTGGTFGDITIRNNVVLNAATQYVDDSGTFAFGTIEHGSRSSMGPWIQDNVAATQTNVALPIAITGGKTELLAPGAGSIVGIVFRSNEARSAGSITVEVTREGGGTGLTAVFNTADTLPKVTRQLPNVDRFSAGDRIGVRITTTADWAPTTADINVTVELDLD